MIQKEPATNKPNFAKCQALNFRGPKGNQILYIKKKKNCLKHAAMREKLSASPAWAEAIWTTRI